MGKFFLAIASFGLMLSLPTWIKNPAGDPYFVIRENSFQHVSALTQPYNDMMVRVSALMHPKKEKSVAVYAWQDSEGNMHFGDKEEQRFKSSQLYEVKDQHQGRFAFSPHWVWACMFTVWLIIYIVARIITSLLMRMFGKVQDKVPLMARSNAFGEYEYDSEKDAPQLSLPHQILGIDEDATLEEIKIAYRNKIKQYHPDKVATMGGEIRELAEQKAVEINQAYRSLVGKK